MPSESENTVGFWEFVSLGRFQWRGQTSRLKAAFFFVFGMHDTHNRLRTAYALNQIERLDLPPGARVLDGGFGRGAVLFELARRHPDWRLTGIELDPMMAGDARRAAERGNWSNVEIIEGSIEDLVADSVYDLVISMDILEHIEDDVGLVKRYLRALKPGGYLVIHVPKRHQDQWRLIPAFRRHVVADIVRRQEVDGQIQEVRVHGHVRDEYSVAELEQVAREAGGQIVSLRETIGRWGELSFELNQLFWTRPALRYLLALLTYPVAVPIGYVDVLRDPARGNALLLTMVRD